MAYSTEKELITTIKNSSYIKRLTNTRKSFIGEEIEGLFGIPDLVVAKPGINGLFTFAFEAKLSNWKRALVQAYKYKAFAKMSYVIMDSAHITVALSNREQFIKSNIGLISFDTDGRMYVHHHPFVNEPYSPQLERKLNGIITDSILCNSRAT